MNRPIHFEILTDEPEKAVAFYEEVFGWEAARWGGPQEYWPTKTGSPDSPGIDGAFMRRHFPQAVINTVSVESLEDTLAAVAAAGGRKVHGPNEIPNVGVHAYCEDPTGILFGVLEPADGGEN